MALGTAARCSSSWGAGTRRVSGEPSGKERALRGVLGELERPLIRGARILRTPERAKQLRPRRVVEVVPIELAGEIEELDVRGLGARDMPDRDRAIQPDDG